MGPAGARARRLTQRLLAAATLCAVAACSHGAAAHAPRAARRSRTQSQTGAFHHVRPGETLWRIARTYGVPLEALRRENALADAAQVEAGAVLFIPGADHELAVSPGGTLSKGSPAGASASAEESPADEVAASSTATPSPAEARATPKMPAGGEAARTKGPRPKPRPAAQGRVVLPQRPAASSAARIDSSPATPSAAALAWPVHGVLFSPFGPRARDQHDGIDLAAPEGTPVVAADAGTVLFAGQRRGYGNIILVGHEAGVVTVYAHNRENLVSPGEHVARGATIARVGRSGNATGPHLHFEVRVAARPRDPLRYLR